MLLDINDPALTRRHERPVSVSVTADATQAVRTLRRIRRRAWWASLWPLRRGLAIVEVVVAVSLLAGLTWGAVDHLGAPADTHTVAPVAALDDQETTTVPEPTTSTTEAPSTTVAETAEHTPPPPPLPLDDEAQGGTSVTLPDTQPEPTDDPSPATTSTTSEPAPVTTVPSGGSEPPAGFCSEPDATMGALPDGGWRCVPPNAPPYEWHP